ncbi:uncharacterized protein LOC134566104 [Pelobates fuscus]|uniref:uncharacterized protein LOC134566104 n=1 Tax=Pelobates fuscus TaxID=191477 RepID=UPI002FE49DD3
MKKQRQPRILKGAVPGRKNKYADSFRAEENTVLVNKLCQYYQCMFWGAAKKTSRAKKDNRWRKIVAAVNAVGGNNRTQEVVKKRYYDIRRMVKRKVKAAAASRKTGGGSQEPDLLPYEEELLQFLGRDNLLGIEGTSGAETSEVQAPQSPEEAPGTAGDAVCMESRAAGSPPVSLEMRLASLSSHHPQLVDVSSPRMSVVSLQQPATGVQEQGSTAERSDGTLPLKEEGTITLTAVDPDSVTSVAEEQSPQLPPPLAVLYATIQACQAELETSIQQDRENH